VDIPFLKQNCSGTSILLVCKVTFSSSYENAVNSETVLQFIMLVSLPIYTVVFLFQFQDGPGRYSLVVSEYRTLLMAN
jgi:hypothetical protein